VFHDDISRLLVWIPTARQIIPTLSKYFPTSFPMFSSRFPTPDTRLLVKTLTNN